MKSEDISLLIKEYYARKPYGVQIDVPNQILPFFDDGVTFFCFDNYGKRVQLTPSIFEKVKLYLFPLSSMTEKQRKEFNELTDSIKIDKYNEIGSENVNYIGMEPYNKYVDINNMSKVIDWLNAHHFDYRGLIKRNLAIDCTNLNIY